MSFEFVTVAAEKYFSEISLNKSNARVISETVEVDKLREFVISRLKQIENGSDGEFWWKDKELLCVFDKLYMAGVILLPEDTVERVRWIALVCMAICEHEGFSYESVLIPPDYLPDSELFSLQYEYGKYAVGKVIKFHKRIAQKGWKSLIG